MIDDTDQMFARLVDFVEGRLTAAERAAVEARAAADPAIAAELASVERLLALMRDDRAEDAPEHVINRALRLIRPAATPSLADALRRVIASLRFDSWRAPLAAGVRTASSSPVRQILFVAEDREIDLRVTAAAGSWRIDGQVLGPEEGGEVSLEGPTFARATLNELSEFALAPLPAGRYRLLLRQGNLEIVVDDLEVGAPASA